MYAKSKFMSRATATVVIGPRQNWETKCRNYYVGNHSYELCPYRHNNEVKKCINCHGDHSAAYRGCPEYVKTQEILKIRTVNKVSYAEAAKKYISEKKNSA